MIPRGAALTLIQSDERVLGSDQARNIGHSESYQEGSPREAFDQAHHPTVHHSICQRFACSWTFASSQSMLWTTKSTGNITAGFSVQQFRPAAPSHIISNGLWPVATFFLVGDEPRSTILLPMAGCRPARRILHLLSGIFQSRSFCSQRNKSFRVQLAI